MKRKRWSNAKTISTLLTGPLVMGVLAVLLCACGASQVDDQQVSQDKTADVTISIKTEFSE